MQPPVVHVGLDALFLFPWVGKHFSDYPYRELKRIRDELNAAQALPPHNPGVFVLRRTRRHSGSCMFGRSEEQPPKKYDIAAFVAGKFYLVNCKQSVECRPDNLNSKR